MKVVNFYYVHRDGFLTTDIDRVKGKCIRVIEAETIEEATKIAKKDGDIQ
jgi:hypothetical protein